MCKGYDSCCNLLGMVVVVRIRYKFESDMWLYDSMIIG